MHYCHTLKHWLRKMKTYPSIPRKIQNVPVYAFDKLDGSNIRAEWSKKKGFYKYGTRKRLLGSDEKPLGRAIELVNDVYGARLNRRFTDKHYLRNYHESNYT